MRLFQIFGVKNADGKALTIVVPAESVSEAEEVVKRNPSLNWSKMHCDAAHSADMDDPKSARMICVLDLEHCNWGAHQKS